MVFKRRDKRSVLKTIGSVFWPKGGWGRAIRYINHRVSRLPDPPHRIARGIFAGVFVTFSPFFGLHFVAAILLARVMRGNMVAALLATFVGNPLTFFAIGFMSLQTGHFLLGTHSDLAEDAHRSLGGKFVDAGEDLRHNFMALFSDETANWSNLDIFYQDVFFPYMVGGIIPGIVFGLIFYYTSLPFIKVYQARRKVRLKAKWAKLKKKAAVDASPGE